MRGDVFAVERIAKKIKKQNKAAASFSSVTKTQKEDQMVGYKVQQKIFSESEFSKFTYFRQNEDLTTATRRVRKLRDLKKWDMSTFEIAGVDGPRIACVVEMSEDLAEQVADAVQKLPNSPFKLSDFSVPFLSDESGCFSIRKLYLPLRRIAILYITKRACEETCSCTPKTLGLSASDWHQLQARAIKAIGAYIAPP